MSGDLKIKVGADVNEAVSGLKNFSKAVDGPINSIDELRRQIKALTAEITSFDHATGNPIGLNALKTELTSAKEELKILEKQSGLTATATGNVFQQAFTGLRQIAYVLPGIGVAGLLGGATEAIIGLFAATKEEEKAAQEAAAANQKLLESIHDVSLTANEATASTAGQIAQVKDLAAAILNTNLPYTERKKALQDLKEINKAYFGDLTLEGSTYEKLTKLVDQYSKALINEAITKKFANEIADVAKSIADADDTTTRARTRRDQATNDLRTAEANLIRVQSAGGKDNSQGVNNAVVEALTRRDAANKKVIQSEKEFQDLLTTGDKLQFQRSLLEERLNVAIAEGLKLKSTKTTDLADQNKEIANIKVQIAALEQLQKAGEITRVELQKLFTLKIDLIKLELPKSKLTPEEAGRLITDLQNSANAALASKPVDLRISLGKLLSSDPFDGKAVDQLQKRIDTDKALKSFQLKADITIVPDLILSDKQLDKKKLIDTFEPFARNISKILSTTLGDAIAQAGATIGGLLSGGSLRDALKAFAGILGDALIQIGKQTIAFAIEITGIQKAINALITKGGAVGAAVAVGLGIAAVALGTVLKNSISKTHAFADGGIVTGPTNALIGERGTEVIFPLSQLNRFIKGFSANDNAQPIPVPFLKGDDIWLVYNRVNQRRGRY